MANSRELAQFASFVNFTGSSIGLTTQFNVSGISTFTKATIFDSTGYIQVPAGNTAQRTVTGISVTFGQIRYNTQLSQFEGFGAGDAWGSLGGVKDVDGDTFIRAESAAGEDEDKLEFLTGDTTRVVIDSTGQVGIGTTIPNATLDVTGHLNVTGVSTFSSNIDANGDLDVDGRTELDITNISETLNVVGVSTLNLLKVSGSVDTLTLMHQYAGHSDWHFKPLNSGQQIDYTFFGENNHTLAKFTDDGAVDLYYDASKKFETTNEGVKVTGIVTATSFHTGAEGSAIRVTSNTISGPSEITIDPAAVGDNTGTVRIKGDLFVDGTQTQINSTTLEIADFVIGIASTATTDALADGAGINIGPDNTFKYEHNSGTNPSLKSSENLNVASGKGYQIAETEVLNATTLGGAVVNSSLTSVGTLGSLNVSGITTISNDLELTRGSSTTSTTRNLVIGGARNNGNDFASLQFKNYDANSSAADYVAAEIKGSLPAAANDGGELVFLTAADGSTSQTERLRISSGGQVGIGTTGTSALLTIQGNSNEVTAPSIRLLDGTDTREVSITNTAGDFVVSTHGVDDAIHGRIKIFDSGIIQFDNGGASGTIGTRLKILADGNIGINESSPTNPLVVKQSSANVNLELHSTSSGRGTQIMTHNDHATFYHGIAGDTTGEYLYYTDDEKDHVFSTDATERLRITSGGNVAIGTDNPQAKLHVSDGANGLEFNPNSQNAVVSYNRITSAYAPVGFQGSTVALRIGGVGTALKVESNGRVAIGTDSPSDVDHTLCVAGTDNTTGLTGGHNQGIQLQNKSTTDGTYSQIEWRTAAGGRYARIAGIQDDADGNGGQLVFLTETSAGNTTERLRITSAGDLQRPKSLSQEVSTSVSTTSATNCGSFLTATYRSAYVIAQITQGTSYQVGRYLLIHDGTTVTTIEESAIATGDMLGTFEGVINGDNVEFRVTMGSASSATVITKIESIVV